MRNLNWIEFKFKFFNSIQIRLNLNSIGFNFNWREMGIQIGAKNIENLFVTMVLHKFSFLFTWELINKFQFGTIQIMDYGNCPKHNLLNLKVSYLTNFNESLLLAKGNNTNNTKILSHMWHSFSPHLCWSISYFTKIIEWCPNTFCIYNMPYYEH
jgi:hypothetical protein